MAIPCSVRETAFGGTEDFIHEECHFDKEEVLSWLGKIDFSIYYNKGSF